MSGWRGRRIREEIAALPEVEGTAAFPLPPAAALGRSTRDA
ncbi:hypothetical protein [Streptosporangium sp. NPDC000509]